MSKRGYITRYLLILKKLKAQRYCSLEELQRYVEKHSEYLKERDETFYVGVRFDRLRKVASAAGWQVCKREIVLDQVVLTSHNLSVFF